MKHAVFDIPEFVDGGAARRRRARYRDGLKRVVDVAGCALVAPIVIPVTALLWVLVRLDGGPGLFAHDRVGLNGKEFRCWKLRTMVTDAPSRLRAHLAADRDAAREWAQDYKLRNDPRITRLGRFLRRSSLDELPQFWNVWRGEMSLVGPRPVPRDELVEYGGHEPAYFSFRPGITGLWQVSGRNDTSYATRVRLDSDYVHRAGLGVDLLIMLRTIGVVLRRTGC